mgnify:CR=1 FL=1
MLCLKYYVRLLTQIYSLKYSPFQSNTLYIIPMVFKYKHTITNIIINIAIITEIMALSFFFFVFQNIHHKN